MKLAVKPFKAIGNWIKSLTLSEKIIFAVCLFVMASVASYFIWKIPITFNSESGTANLLAEEIIHSKEYFPSDWNCRNDIPVFGPYTIIALLTIFMDNQLVMYIIAGIVTMFLFVAASVYCSKVVSGNKTWLVFCPLILCGISQRFDAMIYDEQAYFPSLLMLLFETALFIDSLDEYGHIRSKLKFIFACLILAILCVMGTRLLQTQVIPFLGTLVLFYVSRHSGEKLSDTIKSKDFMAVLVVIGFTILSALVGFAGHKLVIGYVNFLPAKNIAVFSTDFLANLDNLYRMVLQLLGIQPGIYIFTAKGVVNVIKAVFGIVLLIILPILQIRKFNSETPYMRFFTIFACIHVFEIVFLAIFANTISAPRYLFTSMLLLFYLSSHYVCKYVITDNFDIKSVIAVLCACVYIIPIATPKFLSFVGSREAYEERYAIVNHLKEKNLSYGYGSFWNTVYLTYLSNFDVTISRVEVSPVIINRTANSDRYYREINYQGRSFFMAVGKEENKAFLESESYVLFGEPAEVDTFENYYIYIYDYNIANNDFGGLAGGFSGIEFNQLFTMKNDYNAEGIVKYSKEDGYELISSHTAYGLAEDNDSIMFISAEETLPPEIAGNAEEKGVFNEYKVYLTNKQTISSIKNPNYIINSDFTSPLGNEWNIGQGEKAELTDKGVKITCVQPTGRTFVQNVNIPTDLIGKTVTLSISVLDYSGDVGIQIADGYTGDLYVKQNLDRDHFVYTFSFVAKSNVISVSPAVPKNVGSYVVIENVKLEKGGVPTAFTQAVEQIPNENLIENPDFDTSDIDKWTIGAGESIEYSEDSVTVTCNDSVNRVFQQVVNIDDSLVGQPVTFTMSISDYNGEVITRIADSDTDIVYVRQALQQSGNVVFTFIPEDNDIIIQPAAPKNIGANVTINWVKLEAGAASTPYVSEAA